MFLIMIGKVHKKKYPKCSINRPQLLNDLRPKIYKGIKLSSLCSKIEIIGTSLSLAMRAQLLNHIVLCFFSCNVSLMCLKVSQVRSHPVSAESQHLLSARKIGHFGGSTLLPLEEWLAFRITGVAAVAIYNNEGPSQAAVLCFAHFGRLCCQQ